MDFVAAQYSMASVPVAELSKEQQVGWAGRIFDRKPRCLKWWWQAAGLKVLFGNKCYEFEGVLQ